VNPSSAIQQIPTVVPTTPTPNGSEPLIVTDPEDQDRHCYESEGFFKFQYTVFSN
jgi:hypothetical protein